MSDPARPSAQLAVGDECPVAGCTGKLVFVPDGDCSCHVVSPCVACETAKLVCVACGDTANEGTNQ